MVLGLLPARAQAQEVDLFEGEVLEEAQGGVTLESADGSMDSTLSANAGRTDGGVKLEAVRRGNATYVHARVQGKPVLFLLDTGASITTLTPKFAASLGIAPKKSAPSLVFGTANGSRKAGIGLMPMLELGGQGHQHVTFSVCESCGGELPGEKAPVVGLLGMNVLGRYTMSFKGDEGVVELYPNAQNERRVQDIAPWMRMRSRIEVDRSSDREKRLMDYVYLLEVENRAPHAVKDVVVELTCYEREGGRMTARSEAIAVGARKKKKDVRVRTPFTQECVKVDSEVVAGGW